MRVLAQTCANDEHTLRYCNMEKVAEFLASLESDMRDIAAKSDGDFDALPLAVALVNVLGKVQDRKKTVLSYLSHKIVMFDLYAARVALCIFVTLLACTNRLLTSCMTLTPRNATPQQCRLLLRHCYKSELTDAYFHLSCAHNCNTTCCRCVDPLLKKLAGILPPM
jgi:hypothetical protein